MKRLVTLIAAAALGSALSFAAMAAGNSSQEISMALAHAQMAAAASSLGMAHAHLQHVVNCVVGPKSKMFDAKAEDPCKGMGEGAMRDAWEDRAVRRDLMQAVRTAEHGIRATSLEAAHKDASEVAAALKSAQGSGK